MEIVVDLVRSSFAIKFLTNSIEVGANNLYSLMKSKGAGVGGGGEIKTK